jgi:transcriptional regulator with XRE-family HTH domain
MKVNTLPQDNSPISPLSSSFDATIKRYRINARELSKSTGVSGNHISEFKNGKRDVSSGVLLRLLDGMNELAPGAKQYFWQLVSEPSPQPLGKSLIQIIQVADEDELLDAMGAIANRFRCIRNCSEFTPSQSLVNINDYA